MSNVAEIRPPITTVASGFCTSAPEPVAIAIGTKPRLATSAVMTTGRRRIIAPSYAAFARSMPLSINDWIDVTMTRPFRTAIPDRAMNPTAAEIEKGIPLRNSARTPPTSASGTPVNTIAASRTLPNAP